MILLSAVDTIAIVLVAPIILSLILSLVLRKDKGEGYCACQSKGKKMMKYYQKQKKKEEKNCCCCHNDDKN